MKRMTALMITAVLILMLIVPLTAFAVIGPHYVKTANGKGLNLRSAPTTEASVMLSIPYGSMVIPNMDYNDGTWISVEYNGHYGYVMSRYLVSDRPGPAPTPKPKPKPNPTPKPAPAPDNTIATLFNGFAQTNYTVTVRPSTPGGTVHLRWAPTKQAGIMTDFHQGDTLQVLYENKQWAQVRHMETGVTGFMMRSFLQDTGAGSTTPESDS